MSLIPSFAFWVAALLIAALIGEFLSLRTSSSAWEAMLLIAVVALAAVVGITWHQSRVSARRRLLAVWAACAEREIRQQRHRTAQFSKNGD